MSDVLDGVGNWRLWGRMGWAEVRRRYRRTLIGPFWSSLSLGFFVGTMGFLYAALWNQAPESYLPFLCSGMISWVLVSGLVTEGCSTFITNSGLLTQTSFNFSLLACAQVWRSLITFAHNLAIYVLMAAALSVPLRPETLLLLPGLVIIAVNGVWAAVLFGMICARYRDVQQVVSSLLQVAMFVTPVFWAPEQLGHRGQYLSNFNVLFHLVDLIRSPLLGQAPALLSYAVGVVMAIVGSAFTFWLFRKLRCRVVYWL
ncbi:ABC transporter permease [Magnetospirillum sp. UT-4]|uniref:ABC transporter permease n=1 Tax=Magnetospirillum sp. UT-4 TaxID=2681467 RepID=UPI0015741D92|nr:ABC transporter permease [Magnetospirillum sp. UT-4]